MLKTQSAMGLFKLSVLAAAVTVGLSACGGGTAPPATGTTTGTSAGSTSTTGGTTTGGTTTSSSYTIGGTVSGLGATPVVLANGTDTLTVSNNGSFTFGNSVASGGTYNVTVQTQPSGEYCSVSAGSGAASANVSNIVVSCAVPSPVAFSSGFTGPGGNAAPSFTGLTADGGATGGFSGSNFDTNFQCADTSGATCGGGVAANGSKATSGEYQYYQTGTPATGEFVGLYVFAPGVTAFSTSGNTAGITLAGQTQVSFEFNDNPEWATQGAAVNGGSDVLVELETGNLYTVSGQPCHITLGDVFNPTAGAAATVYTLNLSSFTMVNSCGNTSMTVAQALTQPISEFIVEGAGGTNGGKPVAVTAGNPSATSSFNSTVPNTAAPPVYPTTVALTGPITFQ